MAKNAATKPKQAKTKKYLLVRYSRMNLLGLFEHHEIHIPKVPTRVVVETDKGIELGYLVGQLGPYKAGQFKLNYEQIKQYYDDSNIELSVEQAGTFLRYATTADISEERHLRKIAEEEMECCKQFVKELDLPMKIVEGEHIFGGERIIFYFMSETRVDFRDLVKKVAHEYQTRIEMRQIGSRDEAKLLGDVESCGQQCCCQRFLKTLQPVNMRMAKMQKATLDPSKISGYCGRLKCCLRYEDKTYTELRKQLPRKNVRVKSEHGQGRVLDTQILTQLVIVEHDDGTKTAIPVEELEIVPTNSKQKIENSK
jgi:cell fate regulator YaaT (PSP1 superfamily)